MSYLASIKLCLCITLYCCFISVSSVSARSTLIVSSGSPVVIGDGVNQKVLVVLKYFSGDGEAVIETRIQSRNSKSFKIDSLKSNLGEVIFNRENMIINYRENPPVRESVDTLKIYGMVTERVDKIEWDFELLSTGSMQIAHKTNFIWSVDSLKLPNWTIEPRVVYQGEQANLQFSVDSSDQYGLQLNGVKWILPDQLRAANEAVVGFKESALTEEAPELSHGVYVLPDFSGDLQIKAIVDIEGYPDVFLADKQIRVDPLPRISALGDVLTVGKMGEMKFRWTNDGDVSIPLSSLLLRIHPSFADITIKSGHDGARIETDEDGRFILIDNVKVLDPLQAIDVTLNLVAQRPGPFIWKSFAYPLDRTNAVNIPGSPTISATWGQGVTKSRNEYFPTDLQLFANTVRDGLEAQMHGIPLMTKIPIFLKPEGENDSNWVVEDVISGELRNRGYKIVVRPPDNGIVFSTVSYRLVSSRVNYSKTTRWLNLFGSEAKREAFVDMLLRFQDNQGVVRWERRIRAYGHDQVPDRQMPLLGGGNSIKQTVIESDSMIIERGLSAGIIGGLIYIFFIL